VSLYSYHHSILVISACHFSSIKDILFHSRQVVKTPRRRKGASRRRPGPRPGPRPARTHRHRRKAHSRFRSTSAIGIDGINNAGAHAANGLFNDAHGDFEGGYDISIVLAVVSVIAVSVYLAFCDP